MCLGVQWLDNSMAQTNCVPVMRTHISQDRGSICKIKGVSACAKGKTANCNTWKLTFEQCEKRCVDEPKCIAFSFTDEEWNIAHSAGCVMWDESEAAACDSPKAEKSWSTYSVGRDNLAGCFREAKTSLPRKLSSIPVTWSRCKELTDEQRLSHFALVDSKDGQKGMCIAGSGVADDFKVLSSKCLAACTKANGCERTDKQTSVLDSEGHRVSAGEHASVYSIPVLMSKSSAASSTCFSKGSQIVTLDCSSDLKFKDYHNKA
jgi:hypothetical protein